MINDVYTGRSYIPIDEEKMMWFDDWKHPTDKVIKYFADAFDVVFYNDEQRLNFLCLGKEPR